MKRLPFGKLPETSQSYTFRNTETRQETPQVNISFKVPLHNRGEPDIPKQSGKNAQIPKPKKSPRGPHSGAMSVRTRGR